MGLWIFPNDRKLTFLPKMQQRDWIQRNILPVIIAKMAGKDWKLWDFGNQVVHYVPEHASTQRLDIIVENRETAVQGAFSVFGKTYYDDKDERIFENTQRLWQTPARLTGNLNIAQPLTYFPESRSLWQAGLTGKTLFEFGIGTKKFLQKKLPGFQNGQFLIRDCQLLNVEYKAHPKTWIKNKSHLFACYRLAVEDKRTQVQDTQMLYVRAYQGDRSQKKFREIDYNNFTPPRFGEAVVHLPESNMIVWAFPNDPKLRHLANIVDAEKVKKHLPYDRFPPVFQRCEDVAKVTTEVVKYRPTSCCISRFYLETQSVNGPKMLEIYGKNFRPGKGMEIYQRMVHLWKRSLSLPDGFGIAEPLGFSQTIETIWQQAIPGLSPEKIIKRTNYKPLLNTIAARLAIFHRARRTDLPEVTLEAHLKKTQQQVNVLGTNFDNLRDYLALQLEQLAQTASSFSAMPSATVHGDFHINQMLVHQNQIVLLDFEDMSAGDPLQDLAKFIVKLHFSRFQRDFVMQMAEQFIRAYRKYANWEVPLLRLNWHIQRQIISTAYRFFRNPQTGLNGNIRNIFDLAPYMLINLDSAQNQRS